MKIPNDLSIKIERNEFILFLGAGISIGSEGEIGLPSGGKLGAMISQESKHCSEVSCVKAGTCNFEECNYRLEDVAQFFYDIDRVRFDRYLRGIFKKVKRPLLTHKKISSLKPKAVITTNYDTLIERAYDENNIEYSVIIKDEDLTYEDPNSVPIYKIHGCVNKNEPLVITKRSYLIFWQEYGLLIDKLRTLFVKYPILFLGYSLNDQNFQNIYIGIREKLKNALPTSYALVKEPNKTLSKFWDYYKINIIGGDIQDFLDSIIHSDDGEINKEESGNKVVVNLDSFYIDDVLCRGKDMQKVISIIDKMNSGYLVLHGNPGVGKTTIMSYISKKHDYIRYALLDMYSSSKMFFIKNILEQINKKYKIPFADSDDIGKLKIKFYDTLTKLSLQNDKVVIFIDSIDFDKNNEILELLPVPAPPNIVFVLSADSKGIIEHEKDYEILPIKKNDIEEFLQPIILHSSDIQNVFRITEGYPVYLKILKSYLQDKNQNSFISESINQFFGKLIKEIDVEQRDFLSLLSSFEESIDLKTLSAILGLSLREIENYIFKNSKFVQTDKFNNVRIYHRSLKNYIEEGLSEKDKQKINHKIVKRLIELRINDTYLFRNIGYHLYKAGNLNGICLINDTALNNYRLSKIGEYDFIKRDLGFARELFVNKNDIYNLLGVLLQQSIKESFTRDILTNQYISYLTSKGEYTLAIESTKTLILKEERIKSYLIIIEEMVNEKIDNTKAAKIVGNIIREMESITESNLLNYLKKLISATCKKENYFGDLSKLESLNLSTYGYIEIVLHLNDVNSILCKELALSYLNNPKVSPGLFSLLMILYDVSDEKMMATYKEASGTFDKIDLLINYFITQRKMNNNLHKWCIEELNLVISTENFSVISLGNLIDNRLFHILKNTSKRLEYNNILNELSLLCPIEYKLKIHGKILGYMGIKRYVDAYIGKRIKKIDNGVIKIELYLNLLESYSDIDYITKAAIINEIKDNMLLISANGIALSSEWLSDILNSLIEYDIAAVTEILSLWKYKWQLPDLYENLLLNIAYSEAININDSTTLDGIIDMVRNLHLLVPNQQTYFRIAEKLVEYKLQDSDIFDEIISYINRYQYKSILFAKCAVVAKDFSNYERLTKKCLKYVSMISSSKESLITLFEVSSIYRKNKKFDYLNDIEDIISSRINTKLYKFGFEELSSFLIDLSEKDSSLGVKIKNSFFNTVKYVDDMYAQNLFIIQFATNLKNENQAESLKIVNEFETQRLPFMNFGINDIYKLLAVFYLDIELNKAINYISNIVGNIERSQFINSIINTILNSKTLRIYFSEQTVLINTLLDYLQDEQEIYNFSLLINNNYLISIYKNVTGINFLNSCYEKLFPKITYLGYQCGFLIKLSKFYFSIDAKEKAYDYLQRALEIYSKEISNISDRVVCCMSFAELYKTVQRENSEKWIEKGIEEAKRIPQFKEKIARFLLIYNDAIELQSKYAIYIHDILKNEYLPEYIMLYYNNNKNDDKLVKFSLLTKRWSTEKYRRLLESYREIGISNDAIQANATKNEDNVQKAFSIYKKIKDKYFMQMSYMHLVESMTDNDKKLQNNLCLSILAESYKYGYDMVLRALRGYLFNQGMNTHNDLNKIISIVKNQLTEHDKIADEALFNSTINELIVNSHEIIHKEACATVIVRRYLATF